MNTKQYAFVLLTPEEQRHEDEVMKIQMRMLEEWLDRKRQARVQNEIDALRRKEQMLPSVDHSEEKPTRLPLSCAPHSGPDNSHNSHNHSTPRQRETAKLEAADAADELRRQRA